MSAFLVPFGKVHVFYEICRAFFWAGDDYVHGGQCKVAWDEVCAPISKGGLAIVFALKTKLL
jgi:hypothetical protein